MYNKLHILDTIKGETLQLCVCLDDVKIFKKLIIYVILLITCTHISAPFPENGLALIFVIKNMRFLL